MKIFEIFESIRDAVNTAKVGDKTVTIQLQIIKHYQSLVNVSAKEFTEEIGLKPSLVTLYTDSMKLARKLSETGMIKDNV